MKRKPGFCNETELKRPKLQQYLLSMFNLLGPKFVEAPGTQLVCPYFQHKFRAGQGVEPHYFGAAVCNVVKFSV